MKRNELIIIMQAMMLCMSDNRDVSLTYSSFIGPPETAWVDIKTVPTIA